MEKFLKLFENVKGGPISTFIGLALFIFGGVMIYSTYKSENAVVWASFEVGIFGVGMFLLLKSDIWIKDLISKKDG